MLFSRLSRIEILQRVQEDFVMNTVNNAANFGGQKPVIDPGDAVLLLIDHQSGLFQTVKDMEMTVLRQRHDSRQGRDAGQDSRHHKRIRTTGSKRPADPRNSQVRSACAVRRTQRTNQCVGQP